MSIKNQRQSMTFSPSTSITKLYNSEPSSRPGQSVEDAEFAAKKWIWVPDDNNAFIKGFVVSEEPDSKLKVRCTDDSVCSNIYIYIFNEMKLTDLGPYSKR